MHAGTHSPSRTGKAALGSPVGCKLASGGADGALMLSDLDTVEHLQTLRRDLPYERLNIMRSRGLTEVEKATLCALAAIAKTKNGKFLEH